MNAAKLAEPRACISDGTKPTALVPKYWISPEAANKVAVDKLAMAVLLSHWMLVLRLFTSVELKPKALVPKAANCEVEAINCANCGSDKALTPAVLKEAMAVVFN